MTLRDRITAHLANFRRADDGLAAVEFAMVLPLLLLLLLGGFELTQAASTYRKATDTTSQVAAIVSQFTIMSPDDVNSVFSATSQIMYPNSVTNLQIVLSEVSTDANKNATVDWSQAYQGATALIKGSPIALPPGLGMASTSYILVQTTYLYKPTIGSAFIKNIPLHASIFMLPRRSNSIVYTG